MSGYFLAISKDLGREAPEHWARSGGEGLARGVGGAVCRRMGPVAVAVKPAFDRPLSDYLHEEADLLLCCDADLWQKPRLAAELGLPADSGDAALLAALYKKHGDGPWPAVHGPFSFAVWDASKRRAFALADASGARPAAHGETAEAAVVSTRIAAVAAFPGIGRETDPQALFAFFHMEIIPTPLTVYAGVRKLESGFSWTCAGGKPVLREAWRQAYTLSENPDAEAMAASIRSRLQDSIRRAVDVPSGLATVGSFLSGGTDSSAVAGLIHALHPGKARTFSIGFDEPGYDEMHFCRVAAKAYGTDHHEYYVTSDDIVAGLPEIVEAYDEPFGNSSAIPTYFCAKLAREHGVSLLLGGDGGDELFGGNKRYHENFRNFRRFPPWVTAALRPLLKALPAAAKRGIVRQADNYVRRADAPLHERIHAYSLSYYLDRQEIFDPEFLRRGPFLDGPDFSREYLGRQPGAHPLNQYLFNDLKLTLMDNDLPKVMRMTERAGVAVRFPFLDRSLVEFSGTVPPEWKVKDGELRWLYKKAMTGLLPEEILTKPKQGFGLPVVRWMMRSGPLHDLLCDTLFSAAAGQRGIFRKGFLRRIYDETRKDKTTFFGTYLYYAFVLEAWLRRREEASTALS